jgi:hypothetical protein
MSAVVPNSVAAATVTNPAVTSTSILTKSAQDLTHPGASPIGHGDVINWVLSYADNAALGAATITDPITGAPTTQAYAPGSLRVPPGWTPSWSTDGSTFQSTEPATSTVAVKAVDNDAHPGGTNLSRQLLPPVQTTATATGGDGFTPVIYRTPTGGVEAWNTYHHLDTATPKVVCSDLLTGHPCTGGPWPRPLNTTAGPLGSGSTGNIQSTLTPQYVFDPDHAGILYYPAVTTSSVGVGCLDLGARANCGYYPLENTGGLPSSVNGLAGLVTTAGNLYGVDTKGQVLCLAIASHTPCAGQPYAAIVTPNGNGPTAINPGTQYLGSMTLVGNKVFASSSAQGSSQPVLGCFDPGTATSCTGWSTPRTAGPAGSFSYTAFTSYTSGGVANGACTAPVGVAPPQAFCYASDGSALAGPTGFAALSGSMDTFNPETITSPDGHLHSYFAHWGGALAGGTTCWDWTIAARCAAFPAVQTHPGVNGGATRDYGYDYDETTHCLLGLGDAGYLFSMDPATGATPCVRSGASVSLDTAGFYCDGGSAHVHGYQDAKLENINLADVDLPNSTVSLTDPDGTVIATAGFAPDGSVDLSGISITAHPHIVVSDQLVLLNTNDFTGGNSPDLVASFHGDPPQICFHTIPTSTCSVTAVSNTANGSDPSGTLTSNTVSLPVAPGAACQPHVTVNKEICGDARASRCGPGGVGPWLKTSPVGLLGLLGTAHWRITVTNTGSVAANSATLNDSVTPSCATAAGTFTLAAGATSQFYCSSLLLALPLTNTASVTFTAANSPVGTPPTTTASSSATACSLLCGLINSNRPAVH